MIFKLTWYISLLVTTAYAFRYGRSPERFAASVLLVTSLATGICLSVHHWGAIRELIAFLLGSIATILLLILALCSDRWWPLWATSFQIIVNLAILMPILDPSTRYVAVWFGATGYDYLTLVALVVGTRLEVVINRAKELAWPNFL